MSKLIQQIVDAINAVNKNQTQPYDRQGEVKRIEGKIAWVKLEGADRETPIQMTIACDVGDTVQARIGGGSAWLTGNLTAPPTDDKKANEAMSMVTNVVQEIQDTVDEALEDVSSVDDVAIQYCLSNLSSTFDQYGDWSNTMPTYVSGKYYWTRSVIEDDEGNVTYGEPRYSQDTQLSVETDRAFKSNNNHFWYDSSGAYVTTQNKSYSEGSAVRITATGILQQVNGSTVSSWTNSGISFLQGGSTVASFGSGGAEIYSGGYSVASFGSSTRIGRTDDYHLVASQSGIAIKGYDAYGVSRDFVDISYDANNNRAEIKSQSDFFHIIGYGDLNLFGLDATAVSVGAGDADIMLYRNKIEVDASDGVSFNTNITATGNATVEGNLYVTSQTSATSTAKPNCHITTNGIFRYTSYDVSSKKYKNSISKVTDKSLDPHKLYDIDVVQFKYNKDIVSDENDQRYDTPLIGFIAEQVAEVYPVAVELKDAQKGNEVDSWCDQYIIPPMLALIQEQNKRITELEEKIA